MENNNLAKNARIGVESDGLKTHASTLHRSLVLIGILIALVGLFLLGISSKLLYFSDSEIWGVISSRGSFFKDHFLFQKPLFHFMIQQLQNYSYETFQSGLEQVALARELFLGIAIANLFLLFFIAKDTLRSQRLAFLAVFFALFQTVFISHGIKVRADSLSLTFHLFSILFILKSKWINLKSYLIFFILQLFLLLTSLKAIYFVFLDIAVVLVYLSHNPNFRKQTFIKTFEYLLYGCLALIFLTPLSSAYRSAFRFFLALFKDKSDSPAYLSAEAFSYLIHDFSRNPIYWTFVILGFYFVSKKSIRGSKLYFLKIYGFGIILILLVHNHRLPFFIAHYQTPLALVAAFGAVSFYTYMKTKLSNKVSIVLWSYLVLLVPIISVSWQTFNQIKFNANTKQKEKVQYWAKFNSHFNLPAQTLTDRQFNSPADFQSNSALNTRSHLANIYELTGIFAPQQKQLFFLGPGEKERHSALLQFLKSENFDIIYSHQRLKWLEPELSDQVLTHYIEYSPGIFINSLVIPLDEKTQIFLRSKTSPRGYVGISLPKLLSASEVFYGRRLRKEDHFIFEYRGSSHKEIIDYSNDLLIEDFSGQIYPFTLHTPLSVLTHYKALHVREKTNALKLAVIPSGFEPDLDSFTKFNDYDYNW